MGSRNIFILITLQLFLIVFPSFFPNFATSTNLYPPSTICNSTPYPKFCKSIFPNQTTETNVFGFCRSSIRKALYRSNIFLALINARLNNPRVPVSQPVRRALEDCKFLTTQNIDFLQTTSQTIESVNLILTSSQAENVQTLLSAILTDQETCLDGLNMARYSASPDISTSIFNDTKLFSVSLALFTQGWVPKVKKNRTTSSWRSKTHGFRNGKLPLKIMNHNTQIIYDSFKNRRLLQTTSDEDANVLVRDMVTVSQDGSGNFTTINDAVNFAPNNTKATDGYFLIYVTAGVYEEYVNIAKNKKNLMMIGDGINQTVITGDHNVVDGWTTFNSATFIVVAPNFIAVNITVRNTAGPSKHQAVALRNGADLSVFYSCSFEAYQDTLYAHSLRQFYRECDIYGTVDFIFGNGLVVIQKSNIYPRLPMSGQFNAITAQGRTDPNQVTGISIHDCNIKPADDLVTSISTVKTYLGRPWKEYSRTIFMQSRIDGFIDPAGWKEWDGDFALSTLYYGEYNNTGFGADTSKRVTWPGYHILTTNDAQNFTVGNFLLGDVWIPNGIPFTSGLN